MGNNTYINNFLKANDLYRLKEYEDAIRYYKNAITEDNHRAESYYNIGVCYIKLKEFKDSLAFLKLAIDECEIEDKNAQKSYYNIGICHTNLHNYRKAYLYFNVAWSLDNNDEDCKKAIKELEGKLKIINKKKC